MIPQPNDPNFKIHYQDSQKIVYSNTSDEIFVALKNSNVSVRIREERNGISISSHNNVITPDNFNGVPGVRVSGDRFV